MANEKTTSPAILSRRNILVPHLASRLQHGELALVLGAGTSASLGLPGWADLVRKCCNEEKVKHKLGSSKRPASVPDQTLRDLMSAVRAKVATGLSERDGVSKYLSLVRDHLYGALDDDWITRKKAPLLLSIGTLLMGLRSGKVTEVVTYNFDDLLEEYLQYHGFQTQTIADLPCLASDADVRVYHPHGLVSHRSDRRSEFLVFDEASYARRMGDVGVENHLWKLSALSLLLTKQVLFIGLSGNDPIFAPMLTEAVDYVKRSHDSLRPRRYVGYWIFGRRPERALLRKVSDDWGCLPIVLKSFSEIPRLLLEIRQRATKLG